MERIRAKQEKYRQERLPRGSREGQDETETGESWWGPPPILPIPLWAQPGDRDPLLTLVLVKPHRASW